MHESRRAACHSWCVPLGLPVNISVGKLAVVASALHSPSGELCAAHPVMQGMDGPSAPCPLQRNHGRITQILGSQWKQSKRDSCIYKGPEDTTPLIMSLITEIIRPKLLTFDSLSTDQYFLSSQEARWYCSASEESTLSFQDPLSLKLLTYSYQICRWSIVRPQMAWSIADYSLSIIL